MIVALAWLLVALGAGAFELAARRGGPVTGLGRLFAPVTSTRGGRLVLVAVWGFVGIHLFARYNVQPL